MGKMEGKMEVLRKKRNLTGKREIIEEDFTRNGKWGRG